MKEIILIVWNILSLICFPQNVSAVQVGYDASKILTASCAFEYTRYVCGPISNISKYRSGAGYNNITIADIEETGKPILTLQIPDIEERTKDPEELDLNATE